MNFKEIFLYWDLFIKKKTRIVKVIAPRMKGESVLEVFVRIERLANVDGVVEKGLVELIAKDSPDSTRHLCQKLHFFNFLICFLSFKFLGFFFTVLCFFLLFCLFFFFYFHGIDFLLIIKKKI